MHWARRGFALGVLLALLSQAPAVWLVQGLSSLSGARWVGLDVRGTVWNGSARGALTPGPARAGTAAGPGQVLPGRVSWQLRPAWPGVLRFVWQADCCTPQALRGEVRPLWPGLEVRLDDGAAVWPAAWLQGLGAPWNTLAPEGQLHWQSEGLRAQWHGSAWQLRGTATLEARAVATRLSTLRPLGSYRVRVLGGDTIRLELTTLDGALQLQGQGQWQPQFQFRGQASTDPDHEAALSNLLHVLGQRRGAISVLEMGSPP
jgi:general secretion pathway protein N